MSQIGYYRYKIIPTADTSVNFYINGVLASTCNVTVKDFCDGQYLIKYLDSKGQYRFFPFNKYAEKRDSPQLIGKYSKLVTSLLTGQSSERVVGYKNEKTIVLNADVTANELELLKDIYTSASVYMYIGDGSGDSLSDWLEVTIQSDGINNVRKGNMTNIRLTVTLPEQYTINRI